MKRLARQFFAWIVGGALVLLFFVWMVGNTVCTIQLEGGQTNEKSSKADGGRDVFSDVKSPQVTAQTNEKGAEQHISPSFPSMFLCDAKITDVALVFFTYCLAVVGFFAIRSAEAALKKTERAYVFGGPGRQDAQKIYFTIANYGKTAAFVRTVIWDHVDWNKWSATLQPKRPIPTYDVYFPDEKAFHRMDDISFPPRTEPPWDVFFGIIIFGDVFGDTHQSIFEHRLEWNGSHWVPVALARNGTEKRP
jgi:hypothetical protein